MDECRKTQFAKSATPLISLIYFSRAYRRYFSVASEVAISAWTTAESDALSRCGHCDNCKRSPEEVVRKDVTLQAWQLVKIAKALNDSGANVTLNSLATLARGNAGGAFEVSRRKTGKGKMKEKHKLDLEEVAGGEVDLTKEEIEHLLVDLLLLRYLKEKYQQTAYSTNVYVACGPYASILSRHTQQSLANAHDLKIEAVFWRRVRKPRVSGEKSKAPLSSKAAGKRRRNSTDSEDNERESIDVDLDDDDDDGEVVTEARVRHSLRQATFKPRNFVITVEDTDSDDDLEDDEWSISFRKKGPPPKKPRISAGNDLSAHGKIIKENDHEVWVLSDN
ncbi:hypothetical protein C0992_006474 [Termitomyces sp. T32_za158]|nr:hypothetical protein C0992_006474 [Termitomyces sp. T32_za158]